MCSLLAGMSKGAGIGGLFGALAQKRLDSGKSINLSPKQQANLAAKGIVLPTTPTPGSVGARMAAVASRPAAAAPPTLLGGGLKV